MNTVRAIAAGMLGGLLLMLSASIAAAQQYQVVNVIDGATITGRVTWNGGVLPKRVAVPISKDNKICDPNSEKVRDMERLIVSDDGGVANTVVYLKNISKGKAFDLPTTRQMIDQKQCRYVPHIALVPQNGNVQLESSDPILHTAQMAGAASYNIPFPFQNQFVSRTMHQPGLVDIKCNAGHMWMNAEVLVVPHPYYAVTDEHGKFTITGVPPGSYEIEAWHEGWKIAKEETVLDVGTQKPTKRYLFS